jgi:hypothetical protein
MRCETTTGWQIKTFGSISIACISDNAGLMRLRLILVALRFAPAAASANRTWFQSRLQSASWEVSC